MVYFAEVIKSYMDVKGVTFEDMSKKLRLSESRLDEDYCSYFTLKKKPIIKRIADFLGVPFEVLWAHARKENFVNWCRDNHVRPWTTVMVEDSISDDQLSAIESNIINMPPSPSSGYDFFLMDGRELYEFFMHYAEDELYTREDQVDNVMRQPAELAL